MTWEEFNQKFDFDVFSKLMDLLNSTTKTVIDKRTGKEKIKNKLKHEIENLSAHTLLPMQKVGNKYLFKYSIKSKTYDNVEEILIGYFQEFQLGWIFVSLDSSHMWKKLRDLMRIDTPELQSMIIGSNMVFCNFSNIETDSRYYLYKEQDVIDENSFLFKENCVRINDVYVGSSKGHRYFLVLDYAYTSNDFTTNNSVKGNTYFEHLKDIPNSEIIIIFDQNRDLSNQEDVMQKYGDKVMNKLLKI